MVDDEARSSVNSVHDKSEAVKEGQEDLDQGIRGRGINHAEQLITLLETSLKKLQSVLSFQNNAKVSLPKELNNVF